MKRQQPLTVPQAMNRAAALCARSEQATGDIRAKLLRWGLTDAEANQVIGQLVQQGFIDDIRFSCAFVKDRFALNGWGRVKITHQLRLKGVPAVAIDQAMSVIDDDEYRLKLIAILSAKWKTLSSREPRAAWAAMMRFAASRGFETPIAAECVKQVTSIEDVEIG